MNDQCTHFLCTAVVVLVALRNEKRTISPQKRATALMILHQEAAGKWKRAFALL
jgi:hypothetical protein